MSATTDRSRRLRAALGALLLFAAGAIDARAQDAAPPLQLGAAEVRALGIVAAPLRAVTRGAASTGYAQVQDGAALLALLDDAAAAQAAAQASAAEAQRLRGLQRDQDNASLRSVQAADAQAAADAARARSAATRIALEWSPALRAPAPALVAALRDGRAFLLRLEFADRDVRLAVGDRAHLVRLADDGAVPDARVLGPAGGAASVLSGPAWLAAVEATGLHAGERLRARLDAAAARGVLLPDAAAIMLGGRRWAYVALGGGRYQRRALPADAVAVAGGWRLAHGFAAGEAVVVQGAAQLVAAERKPAPGAADEADSD
ncbi:MAG: hypothetical protein ABFC67_07850 [Mizugakiibacter sp.]|uniref:hypothetical protein n=1 Tax=Mizugakiibacter sp. TaxID=1972610 RepID=UPI0031BEA4CB|nr:hypothetical protein [Xanthomonadaceae bacterium]